MKFDIPTNDKSIIKVVGVGGGGGNAVSHMYRQGITGVDFAICNTDAQAMENSPVSVKIALGPNLTEGRGAGSMPEVGKQSCIESIEEIRTWLDDGTKMLFITAGMGGGTGTGAAPIIAKIAREMDILTVAIVTLPFKFEGLRRQRQAHEGLEQLKKNVDSILVISNDKLKKLHSNLALSAAFGEADNILTTAAKGIAEIITVAGYINVDFEDVNTVMRNSGVAIMGSAFAEGDDRAAKAISLALSSPLLEDNDIRGAQHILLNITSGTKEVTMDEIGEITEHIQEEAGYGTDLIWGNCHDASLGDKIMVTLIATGFHEGSTKKKEVEPGIKKVALESEKIHEIVESDYTVIDLELPTLENVVEFDDTEVRKTKIKLGIEDDDFSGTRKSQLSEELRKKQEADAARRDYLRKSNSKPLDSPKIIADMENVPAYARRNVVLEDNENKNGKQHSTYMVNMDDDNNIMITNNSFLYDNVD
ncbi:MAG TPA: cell division protein FtsZ [Saprospiraceae bacterium]|jgi:cell division protein FtsZ|nr:cell division protein FtsZ [Saprospiraceae bacterium]HRO08876.1 cell division protein FtsZ [Saprospiraceae bacterium]HRP42131.1 cell division protein FtsZ [Saprospiraceae bacterium]